MKEKIYATLLAMGLVCMAVTLLISTWFFWRSTQRQIGQELQLTMAVVETGWSGESDKKAYLKRLSQHQQKGLRLTWINHDGTILFESDSLTDGMENHLARPEVQAALQNGSGKAVRDSKTLDKALYYYAQKMPDDTILRVSLERDTFYAQFFSLLPWVLFLLALAAFTCIKTSRRLTASLLRPIRETASFIKKLNDPAQSFSTPPRVDLELQPLVDTIFFQSQTISRNIHYVSRQRNIMHLMMENLQEGVVLTDANYRIVGINTWAARFLGADTAQELKKGNLKNILADADWQRLQQADTLTEQYLSRSERRYLLTIQPVYKEEKRYGTLFIIDDVTEAEHREQLRREFTANVSHELKTPLTSISGFAEVLAAGMFQDKKDVVHFGGLIYKEARRLLSMIEEIMHLARIEDGKRPLHIEVFSLTQLVQDIVAFMAPVFQEKNITLHTKLCACPVKADKGLLRELIMNLLDNAVKYNRPGGHIYLSLAEDKGKAILTVRDTGIGIPEDKQSRVFERFYRADSSRSQKISGTGLGLALVKHIVEQHHGTISLKSKENKGTEVTVTLPKNDIL